MSIIASWMVISVSIDLLLLWRIKLKKVIEKDHFSLPFIDQMLDRMAENEYYCFLDSYLDYNQIAIALENQEKTIFKSLYKTFTFWKMPFALSNNPKTFQCCITIFSNMI